MCRYAIVSGVKKGAILSRNPDGVAYTQTLGGPNFHQPPEYVIITNWDFFFHDIRELFDPTGGKAFPAPSRRVAAQTILNATLARGALLAPIGHANLTCAVVLILSAAAPHNTSASVQERRLRRSCSSARSMPMACWPTPSSRKAYAHH